MNRNTIIALASALGLGCVTPALAFDCMKAVKPVEQRICADKSLQSADEQMNAAYTKLLNSVPDSVIREMLVRSQRRWIHARNKRLDGDFEGNPLEASEVRKAIVERTALLEDQSDQGLIATAQAERRWLANYAGGPFSGFDADCSFIPDDRSGTTNSYTCFGAVHVQNYDRVCSQSQDWATWRIYIYSSVSRVDGVNVNTHAYCDSQSHTCDNGSNQAGWVHATTLGKDDRFPHPVEGLPRLDAEMWPLVDAAWFSSCLTTSRYPAAF